MIKDARCIFVVGRRGSGKTTLTRRLAEQSEFVIAFDPMAQWASEFHWPRAGDLFGFNRMMREKWSQRGARIAYVPVGDMVAELDHLSAYLWTAQRDYGPHRPRKLTLVIEEMDLSFPSRVAMSSGFFQLVCQGRHRGIEIIGVTTAPGLVSATFRRNVAETYVFPLGYDEDRALWGRENKRAIAGLTNHHYLHVSDAGATRGENPPLRAARRPAR